MNNFHDKNLQEDPIYREIILEHLDNPQNYGVLEDPDFDVTDLNPLCGDEIRLTGKISNGKLIDIKFESRGCAISRASASIFTEKIKREEIEQIKKLKPADVIAALGIELTPARTKCALLVYNTFLLYYKSNS